MRDKEPRDQWHAKRFLLYHIEAVWKAANRLTAAAQTAVQRKDKRAWDAVWQEYRKLREDHSVTSDLPPIFRGFGRYSLLGV